MNNKNIKTIVEIGYYEVRIRPFRKGDVASYYDGVGGLFKRHKNVFRSFDAAMNHIEKSGFDDSVVVHKDFENELVGRSFDAGSDLEYDNSGEWVIRW